MILIVFDISIIALVEQNGFEVPYANIFGDIIPLSIVLHTAISKAILLCFQPPYSLWLYYDNIYFDLKSQTFSISFLFSNLKYLCIYQHCLKLFIFVFSKRIGLLISMNLIKYFLRDLFIFPHCSKYTTVIGSIKICHLLVGRCFWFQHSVLLYYLYLPYLAYNVYVLYAQTMIHSVLIW